MQCEAWKSIIQIHFGWIYRSHCRSSSNSIYLCFPLLGLSLCHFTSDVAELTVLSCKGYIKPHILEYMYIFATNAMGLEQICTVSVSDKKTQNPCHFYDRAWPDFEGIHSFLEKGSFIWESSSLTQWPRRNVWSCGLFGSIYTVKRGRTPRASFKHAGIPKHARQRGDTNSDQLGSQWFSCREPE